MRVARYDISNNKTHLIKKEQFGKRPYFLPLIEPFLTLPVYSSMKIFSSFLESRCF